MENYSSKDSPPTAPSTGAIYAIRFVGLGVLLLGLIIGIQVVQKAWELLDQPGTIMPLAEEIERRSQLNPFVERVTQRFVEQEQEQVSQPEVVLPEATVQPEQSEQPKQAAVPKEEKRAVNASYFAAWVLVFTLLTVIGRVACWAITAGGKVALYSTDKNQQLKQVLREFLNEVKLSGDQDSVRK